MRAFASDNYAGAHPDVLAAVAEANRDHAVSYGDDPWTARAHELLRRHFGEQAEPWLVFNGTAANVLALGALCRTWEGVITPATSHLHVDAAGMAWRRKQHAQLASKMRFLSAQVVALLEGDLWRRCAEHANAMARRLAEGAAAVPGV